MPWNETADQIAERYKRMANDALMKIPIKKSEDTVLLKREMEAVKTIHDALLTVAPERRGPIVRAVAILLQIHVPQD